MKMQELDARNGVTVDGYDPKGVASTMPWCVEAWFERYQTVFDSPLTTKQYKATELLPKLGHRSGNISRRTPDVIMFNFDAEGNVTGERPVTFKRGEPDASWTAPF